MRERSEEEFGPRLRMVASMDELAARYIAEQRPGRDAKNKLRAIRHHLERLRSELEADRRVFRYRYLSQRLALLEEEGQQSPIARELEAIKRQIQRAEAKCVQAGGTDALALDERDAA